MNIPTDDLQFQESLIESVRESGDYYELTHNGAWVIGCPKVDGLPTPQVGETIRTYGRGIGSPVRGIVVNGRVYRYQTEAEQQAEHEQWCRDQEAKREQEFNEKHEETDRRIAALPLVFRERLDKFQRDGGQKFRRDYEGYELFCCEQAVVIADALKTEAAIAAWRDLPWGVQQTQVPGLSDQHSGNTFGAACALARFYVTKPEFVAKMHGALVPLVGCDDYGCKHESSSSSSVRAEGRAQ